MSPFLLESQIVQEGSRLTISRYVTGKFSVSSKEDCCRYVGGAFGAIGYGRVYPTRRRNGAPVLGGEVSSRKNVTELRLKGFTSSSINYRLAGAARSLMFSLWGCVRNAQAAQPLAPLELVLLKDI